MEKEIKVSFVKSLANVLMGWIHLKNNGSLMNGVKLLYMKKELLNTLDLALDENLKELEVTDTAAQLINVFYMAFLILVFSECASFVELLINNAITPMGIDIIGAIISRFIELLFGTGILTAVVMCLSVYKDSETNKIDGGLGKVLIFVTACVTALIILLVVVDFFGLFGALASMNISFIFSDLTHFVYLVMSLYASAMGLYAATLMKRATKAKPLHACPECGGTIPEGECPCRHCGKLLVWNK